MGYSDELVVEVRASVSNHNSEQDELDREAVDRLRSEIEYLVDSDPDYRRVVRSV